MNTAMTLTSSCLDDRLAVWQANRRNWIRSLTDLNLWERLFGAVQKFKPDLVISASRKMPRLVNLWQAQAPCLFSFDATFLSDLAVEFNRGVFKDKRVAILDDSVNTGSTLAAIYSDVMLGEPSEAVCFFIGRKQRGGRSLPKNMEVRQIQESDLPEKDYRARATRLSRCLWTLNRPLEIEFPVFRMQVDPSYLAAFESSLSSAWEWRSIHNLDIPEAPDLGLHRLSLDLSPENRRNNKIRFYIDIAASEMIITPMAYCEGVDCESVTERRFLASLDLARDFFERFPLPVEPELVTSETTILFGEAKAKEMQTSWQNNHRVRQERYIDGRADLDCDFYNGDWNHIKPLCGIIDRRFLHDCFNAVMKACSQYYYRKLGPQHERLTKGPTYRELLQIMEDMWDAPNDMKKEFLAYRLSEMLDEQIDNGAVVPMSGEKGRRIFRKGEPYAWQRSALLVYKYINGDVDPAEDLQRHVQNLPDSDRKRFQKIMLELESPTMTSY